MTMVQTSQSGNIPLSRCDVDKMRKDPWKIARCSSVRSCIESPNVVDEESKVCISVAKTANDGAGV